MARTKKLLGRFVYSILSFSLLLQSILPLTVLPAYAADVTPTPTPTEQVTPTPTSTSSTDSVDPTPAPSDTPTPADTPSVTPTPTDTPTPTETPTSTPTPTVTITPTDTLSADSAEPTPTPTPTTTITPTETPSVTPTSSADSADSTPTTQSQPQVTASPSIFTDKLDYSPTDSVVISGKNFQILTTYTIVISSTDDPAVNFSDQFVTDAAGSFTYTYQLDGNYRPNYKVEIKLDSQLITSTTFTDTVPADVSTYAQLVSAAADTNVSTINITADITDISHRVDINHSITINGNGHTLSPNFSWGGNSDNATLGIENTDGVTINDLIVNGSGGFDLHGINVYVSTNVLLSNVSLLNNGRAGMVVNGSTVTVNNITTAGNGWGGINVDQGSSVTTPAVLIIQGTSSQAESTAIWEDDYTKDVSVQDTHPNQYDYTDYGNKRVYTLRTSGSTSVDLDQCANGGVGDPPVPCTGSAWQNGDLNGNKAHYREGDSVPYRFIMTNLTSGSHSLTIEWDTTKSGKNATDFLTTYNQTETSANPCSDITGCNLATNTTFAIPVDPHTTSIQIPGNFTLFNGTITSVSSYTVSGPYTGDSSTRITISFDTSSITAVLAVGGHIASQIDWGIGNSASSINGSPYHMRLIDLDGSGGNQDRALSAEAVPPVPTIDTQANPSILYIGQSVTDIATLSGSTNNSPDITGNVDFYVCGPDITNPDCTTGGTMVGSSKTISSDQAISDPYSPSQTGDYCFRAEYVPDSTASYSPAVHTNKITECFSVSNPPTGTLHIIKHVINDNGGSKNASDFTINVTATNPSQSSFSGSEKGTDVTVDTGSYSVDEVELPGYSKTLSTDCSGTISANETKTCTITNNDIAPSLTLVKDVVNKGGSNGQPKDWTLIASGPSLLSGTGIATSGATFKAGTYTLSESGPSGYTASSWNCTGGSLSGDQLTLGLAGSAICTITNTRDTGSIVVHKDVRDPDGNSIVDGTTFHTLLDGGNEQNITESNPVTYSNLPTGDYTVSEATPPAGYSLVSISNGGKVTVTTGTKDVYIVNQQQKAHLTVHKIVEDPSGNSITNDLTQFTANVGAYSGAIYQGHDATFDLNPNTYSVTESTNTDYDQLGCKLPTGADATGFTLTPGEDLTVTCTNEQKPATITVYKNVIAADGKTDVSDSHIFHVTLNSLLKDFSEPTPATYSVNPGSYNATESSETNYTLVGNTGPVTVGSNGSASILITNEQNPGSISGYKYDDTTLLGIPNWLVYLTGDATAQTYTDSNGFYQFTDLNVGSYTVTEDTPSGWTPDGTTSYNVSVTPGSTSPDNNFYNFKNISVTACKVIDADGDTSSTKDQTPKSGWGVSLDNGTTTDSKLTESNGCYTWSNIGPGTYTVKEDVSSTGWTPLSPTSYTFTAQSATDEAYTFINFENGYISGHKYNDLNGNGTWDNGEPAIQGWTIKAVYPDQSTHTRTTNSSGYYSFSDLGPGNYTITEDESQSNWTRTSNNASYTIDMTSDGAFPNKDFGNQGSGTITVHKIISGTPTDLSNFCFTLSPDPGIGEKCADSKTGDAVFNNVPAGTYAATETTSAPNYTEESNTCSNMTITNGGDTATCDVTNTRDTGRVNFLKTVDDGSDVSAWTFTVNVNGTDETFHSGDSATLDTGTYTATESGSSDYTLASVSGICSDKNGSSATLTVTKDGGTCTFSNEVNNGTIQGTKYYDENVNGLHDYNKKLFTPYEDQLLNGWEIRLYDSNWGYVTQTTTSNLGNQGQYRFSEKPGTYYVCEVNQTGWKQAGPILGAQSVDNNHNPTGNGIAVANSSPNASEEGDVCWKTDLKPSVTDGWLKFGNIKTSTVTMCKQDDNQQPLSGWNVGLLGSKIQSLNIPVDNSTVNSQDLSKNDYVIWTQGYYRFANWGSAGIADAEYSLRIPGQHNTNPFNAWISGDDLGVVGALELQVNGTNINWGAFNPSHNYLYGLIDYSGPISFGIYDNNTSDNNNIGNDPLIANIYKGYAGTTGSNGCVTFNNVPYGNYTAQESLQKDWINLSGQGDTLDVSHPTETFTLTNALNKGTVTIIKNVDNNNDGDVTDPGDVQGATDWTWNVENGEQNISTGDSRTLNVGDYVINENNKTDYHLVSWTCNNRTSGYSNYIPISLSRDENLVCTITNARDTGTIIVHKDLSGGATDLSQFCFTLDPDPGTGTVCADPKTGNAVFSNVPTQHYTINENTVQGWDLSNATCSSEELETTFDQPTTEGFDLTRSDIQCTFTNTAVPPTLTLTKSNNASGDKSPGGDVAFTLTLTVHDNDANNVVVKDLPAHGFTYRTGSWVVLLNGNPISISEPQYHSPGAWNLGDLNEGDVVTMTYYADIDTNEDPGLYKDLAWAQGEAPADSSTVYSNITANNTDPFVGTNVNVVKDQTQTESYSIEKTVTKEGEVLGATTYLPATGADTLFLIFALINLGLGIQLVRSSKKYEN